MGDEEDGALLLLDSFTQLFEQFELVEEVEGRGGFVEEEDGGVLGEGSGDSNALAFAAGEGVDGAVDEVMNVGGPHETFGEQEVGFGLEAHGDATGPTGVGAGGVAGHEDDFADGVAEV